MTFYKKIYTIWNPPTLKAKVLAHSLRLLLCVGIWFTPDVFELGNGDAFALKVILILCALPSWCRSITFALAGYVLSVFFAMFGESGEKDVPHDAIPGDPGPSWSEEWREPSDWTRFHRK